MRQLVARCLLVATAVAAYMQAQAPVFTGNWMAVTHKLDDGTEYKAYFQLHQEETAITGRVIYPWGIVKITSGTANGNHFHLVHHLWEGLEFEDDGELSNGELRYRGTNFDHQWHEYVGHRVPDEEGNPPGPLPLPALHEVPYNGLAKTPPMGWNSWNKFGTQVSDTLLRQMADTIVSTGMRDAGYIYINIDDGWEGRRDGSGVLQPNLKFPDMKTLADYLHGKGLKLGIYSSPGPNTCAGYQGSFGHEELDAKTWAEWGIDYLKYDTCSAGKIYRDEEMRGVYQKMGDALLKSGRSIVFSVSSDEKAYTWARQAGANLWRTTGDISDNWKAMNEIGFRQDVLASYAGPGHWNDPDMLEVGNGGMTADEYRTHLSLWALLAAPLLAGNDLRNMTQETKSILMNGEVIAVDQDPLGREGTPISRAGSQEIWARQLAAGGIAVGLFNRGEEAAEIKCPLSELHVSSHTKARNLWTHADVEIGNSEISANVPRHGVALFRINSSN